MNRRMWLLGVAAWVAVVIAGSGITWFAISSAGSQVSQDPGSVATEPVTVGTVGPAPQSTPSTTRPAASATAQPTRTASTRPTAVPGTPTPTFRPPPRPVTPATQVRTWSGRAGTVTVSCTGSALRFRGASPADGWSIEPGDRTGSSIEVKFHNAAGTEVTVQAHCSGGIPRFVSESSGSGDN